MERPLGALASASIRVRGEHNARRTHQPTARSVGIASRAGRAGRAGRAARASAIATTAAACAPASLAGEPDIWADRIVWGVQHGEPAYEPGLGTPVTVGPFSPANPLWRDPASLLGKPNTIDYDDLMGAGPVPGGFAGGPMRRVHLAWPCWQWGTADPALLGQRPGWLDGRRQNGVGLTQGAAVVVEFDEPIENNPDDGGLFHWGTDLIVHGNSAFAAGQAVAAGASLDGLVLTGGLVSEPVTVDLAQSIDGPWHRATIAADALFPTHPWAWGDSGWTGDEQDWTRPVDPGLTLADFAGLTAAAAAELYAGSAGGTPIDLDHLVDDQGSSAPLAWARFVRVSDPSGLGGEITAIADVPPGPAGGGPCSPADIALPLGTLDLADITAFANAFTAGDGAADLAPPLGTLDLQDITAFVGTFAAGCP